MSDESFDVIVLGGGAAGSAAALTLLDQGARVLIIEASGFNAPRIGESIPPDTNLLLDKLGVRQAFLKQGHLPCPGSQSCWGSAEPGYNDFLVSPHGHGWHLDRTAFDAMLFSQALARGAVAMRCNAQAVESEGDSIQAVRTEQGRAKAAHFIDATGRKALIGRHFGVERHIEARHVTLWAHFTTITPFPDQATRLEAMPYGWWYAAPLPKKRVIVALGTTPREAKKHGLYDLRHWAFALSESRLIAPPLTNARLEQNSFCSTASTCFRSTRVTGHNWLLAGDAASALDPLSSAGIYKALSSGHLAAQSVLSGDFSAYETRMKSDHEMYRMARKELYAAENRWPLHPFWKAEQARAG